MSHYPGHISAEDFVTEGGSGISSPGDIVNLLSGLGGLFNGGGSTTDPTAPDLTYAPYGFIGIPTEDPRFPGQIVYDYQRLPNFGGGGGGPLPPMWRPGEFGLLERELDDAAVARRLDRNLQRLLGLEGIEVDRERLALERLLGLENLGLGRAQLQEQGKRRAMDAALGAINAYLSASSLADARRLNVLQETRALLPFMVDPSQEFFSGFGPNSALAQESRNFGFNFDPVRIQHMNINPQQALAPSQNPVGELGPNLGMLLGGLNKMATA